MGSSYTQLFAHLVWATKLRAPTIVPAVAPRLYGYLATRCTALRCTLLDVGGMADHVHVLVALSPDVAMSQLARELKAPSTTFAHRALALKGFAWQSGYGAFTLRASDVETVRRYIRDQAQHHAHGSIVADWEQCESPDGPARPV